MRGLLTIASGLLILFVAPMPMADGDDQDPTVYITKTGEKYHASGCSSLSKSRIATTLSDAVSRGYSPCSRCEPPTRSNTPRATPRPSTDSPSGQCQATTQKGTRCSRRAKAGSRYCYQHGG